MRRRRWVEDGILAEASEMSDDYQRFITEAWDCVVQSRASFLKNDWKQTDHWSRQACITAARALIYSRGYRPAGEFNVRDARDYCFDTFGVMGDEVFTRAELVGEFLPLPEELGESQHRLFRKTVAASSEMVALIECHIAVEKRPPSPPPDPHYRYRMGRRLF